MTSKYTYRTSPHLLKTAAAVAFALVLNACSDAGDQSATKTNVDLAITGVNIVDVESGNIVANQTIYINDGTIVAVAATGEDTAYSAIDTNDQTGMYATPGLWDMHVHFRGGPELVPANELFLSHFTGFGITGVRDAAGDMPDEVNQWRREITEGARTGPNIFTSLQKLDGLNPTWEGSIPVQTIDDIEPAIDQLVARKPDFIKVYDSTLAPNLYLPTLHALETHGLDSAAHLPFSVAFRDAVEAGLDSIEHAMYLHKAASRDDAAISAILASGERVPGVFGKLIDSYDADHFAESLALAKAHGTAITPTLYVDHLLRFLDVNDHKNDPHLTIIPEGIQATYRRRVAGAEARGPEQITADHNRMNTTISLVPTAHVAGVTLLAGSDTGAFNSYVYPGDSLHQEMRMMQEAGLEPITVLRAATINGAAWLSRDSKYGSITAGKMADILLLEANPLEDINNTRTIAGLLQAGRYFNKSALQSLRQLTLEK